MRALVIAMLAACSFPTPPALSRDGATNDPADDADAGDVGDAAADGAIDAAVDAPIDAPIDSPPETMVIGSVIPLRIAITDSVPLSFTLQGPPSTVLQWSITSGGGTFAPSSGVASTTATGTATASTTYTAPATGGDLVHTLAVTATQSSATPFTTKVRTLRRLGELTPFTDNAGLQIAANTLAGQTVTTDTATVLMRIGVIPQTGGYNGRLALYANSGGAPAALLAATSLTQISGTAQEIRVVTPTQLAQDTYWVMANFDAAAPIKRSATNNTTIRFITLATSAALPDPIVSPQTSTNRVLNYYLVVAD